MKQKNPKTLGQTKPKRKPQHSYTRICMYKMKHVKYEFCYM